MNKVCNNIVNYLNFTNLVVFGEAVIIKYCENQSLVKGFAIRYLKNEYVGISWMYSVWLGVFGGR